MEDKLQFDTIFHSEYIVNWIDTIKLHLFIYLKCLYNIKNRQRYFKVTYLFFY